MWKIITAWLQNQTCSLVTVVPILFPNLPLCGNDAIIFSYQTIFEGSIHNFGVCACKDSLIFLGVRPGTYFEFNSESMIDFIENEACAEKSQINYILVK